MNIRYLAALAAVVACPAFGGNVEMKPGGAEIVVAADAPKTVRFAAKTLNRYLGESLGGPLPVVTAPTEGKTSVVLGDNALSRAAGIDVGTLARDAYVIKSVDGHVYIAGRDDAKFDLEAILKSGTYWQLQGSERATLFGVYEFLERYAGCRFYFPGELGTVVPKREKLTVPEGTHTRAPVFSVRDAYLQGDGPVPGETDAASRQRWMVEDWLLLRLQTTSIRCCHGQNHMRIKERFAKTHPEYFRAVKSGTNLVRQVTGTQLCQASGLWDEIYEDAKAYLSGKPPSSRGFGNDWGRSFYGGCTIEAMPEDGMQRCACPDCAARYNEGEVNWATDLVWEQTSRLADRLERDGFKFRVTQMAYPEYKNVPRKPINTNVWVMVAESGPWSMGSERRMKLALDELRAWTEKIGHKVWMWTYPSKFNTRRTEGVPCYAPRTCGRYFRMTVPYSVGSFVEATTQDSLFSYLNNYAFSRVAWNADVDVDAVVDEHHRLMFGAAAPEMKAFLDDLETRWMREIIGAWIFPSHDGKTELDAAPDVMIWTQYLTRDVREGWKRLFDAAAKKVPAGSLEARRVALYKKHFLDYIVKTGDAFDAKSDPESARKRYAALKPGENLFATMSEPIHLVAKDFKGASWGVDLPNVKPNTRYHLSAIVKLKDVRLDPSGGTGAFFDGYMGDWRWFPRRAPYPAGTADWHYVEYDFTSGKEMTSRKQCMRYCIARASGEAWIDCLTLREIGTGDSGKKQK